MNGTTNIAEIFARYLESKSVATLGQDLFIGEAPSTLASQPELFWIIPIGGAPDGKFDNYTIEIWFRSTSGKTVYDKLQYLKSIITCDGCFVALDGDGQEIPAFDIIDIEVQNFFADRDVDSEDRKVGAITFNITTYEECNNG